jgi:ATP-binding protein involved in chromosome partitioning
MPLPLEIIGLHRPDITLVWEDEHRTTYSARALRLRCRCAHCVEEMSGRPLLDPARVPEDIVARSIELVGQYAILIRWSDGHETGIYHFRRLREDCPCQECEAKRPKPA